MKVLILLATFATLAYAEYVANVNLEVPVFNEDGHYLTTYDDLDLERLFGDEIFLRKFINCLKGLPCTSKLGQFVRGTVF